MYCESDCKLSPLAFKAKMVPELRKFPQGPEGQCGCSKGHLKPLTQGDTGKAQ